MNIILIFFFFVKTLVTHSENLNRMQIEKSVERRAKLETKKKGKIIIQRKEEIEKMYGRAT